jgi:hypothetical protein
MWTLFPYTTLFRSKSKKDAGFIQNHDCHVLIGKPQSHRPDARFRGRRIDAGDAAALCQTAAPQ